MTTVGVPLEFRRPVTAAPESTRLDVGDPHVMFITPQDHPGNHLGDGKIVIDSPPSGQLGSQIPSVMA